MSEHISTWQRCGAWLGGTVAGLAVSPNFAQDGLILAATAAGLFRSLDGGWQWQPARHGLPDPRITAVAFGPVVEAAFVATADGRLFQSEDGGVTWRECSGWAGLGLINVLCVSPNFALDYTLFVATAEGIFRSQDGGGSWESSTFGLLDLEILCLACATNFGESEVLWAGSALGGFYRSRNGARSWRDSGFGLPDMAVQCIAVSPTYAQDQTLYVGTESDGVYCSTDGGANWHVLSPDLAGQPINALAISADGQVFWAGTGAGVYTSTDGGHQWAQTVNGAFLALSLALPTADTAIAGAYHDGVLRWSSREGAWQPALADFTAHVPPAVLGDPVSGLTLLNVEGALVQSQDAGATWHLLNPELADEAVLAMAQAVAAGGPLLYAVTASALYGQQPPSAASAAAIWHRYPLPTAAAPTLLVCSPQFDLAPLLLLADAASQFYCSADGGAQWQALTVPWTGRQLLHLAISPLVGARQPWYALTAHSDPEQHYQLELWQSSDQGGEWLVLADFYADAPAAVMTLPLDPVEQPILVGVHNRLIKIYQTAERTWALQQHFLGQTQRITSIATTATYLEDHAIFVTTNDGLLQSHDGGATWTAVGAGLAGRTMVAFCPGANDRPAYAVELGGAIWRR